MELLFVNYYLCSFLVIIYVIVNKFCLYLLYLECDFVFIIHIEFVLIKSKFHKINVTYFHSNEGVILHV